MTEMKKILLSTILILAFAVTAYAVPVRTAEKGVIEQKSYSPAQETCYMGYYNFCSGWVFYWSGYCYGDWATVVDPPQYGTVFDLGDCPNNCRHMTHFYWGCKRFTMYGNVDVEVFCASDCGCPLGEPLVGFYGYNPDITTAWQLFIVDELALCPCDSEFGFADKFVVLITDHGFGAHSTPYSDIEVYNIDAGCQVDWDCVGHSFHYSSAISYCDVYGMPGPFWVSGPYGCTNVPTVPPGCHDYYGYGAGMFTELLIDVYVACLGPTATDNTSWSEIKSLYR
jgi:hypothetical protein